MLLVAIFCAGDPARAAARDPSRCGAAYGVARDGLRVADLAQRAGKYRRASLALDDALRSLGSAYHRPDLIDDTGLALTRGRVQERRGRLRESVLLKRRVLQERLELCEVR
jgi:hypothetical protein